MNYRIVIPSRKRLNEIKVSSKLLPTATVVVRHEEVEDYKKIIDNEIVSLPKDFDGGIARIRSWIMNKFEEETIIFCDDDVTGVYCLVGQKARKYKDWDVIKQIFENTLRVSKDLGVSLFYFHRDKKPWYFSSGEPFTFSGGFASSVFGVIGRKLIFDERLYTREDIDLTLQALLKDRIVFSDKRFYFDVGPIWSGIGGNQGLRNSENEDNDIAFLYKKWGKWLVMNVLDKGLKHKKFTKGTRLAVPRKSPLV